MLEVERVSKTLDANFTITSLLPLEVVGGIFMQKGISLADLQLRVKAASKFPVAETSV
jgi:hypothetical protein